MVWTERFWAKVALRTCGGEVTDLAGSGADGEARMGAEAFNEGWLYGELPASLCPCAKPSTCAWDGMILCRVPGGGPAFDPARRWIRGLAEPSKDVERLRGSEAAWSGLLYSSWLKFLESARTQFQHRHRIALPKQYALFRMPFFGVASLEGRGLILVTPTPRKDAAS